MPSPSVAFNLFATHEVTTQFATQDGKPMANAEVQVFAPGDSKTPVITGRTDAEGKFVFEADRDGFWSAEAHGADQVARVMIRVGGESQQPQSSVSPFLVIGVLAILLAIAIWYRLLRARSRRPVRGQILCQRSSPGCCALIAVLTKSAPAALRRPRLGARGRRSASVTADSYVLQRNGIARAFEDPRLVNAISAVPGGIEALVLEWSDPDRIAVTVGWTRLADADSAAAFAAAVRATKRSSEGLTAIGPALLAAAAAFDDPARAGARRRVIDISGDGMANFGLPPKVARDRIVAAGISINGLAILTEEPWLEAYYRSNVIGGPGAFVVVARDFGSFADAMLRKLVQEVAGTPERPRDGSDAVSPDRLETVEPDRGVARGVGAGRQDLDLVADLSARGNRYSVFS